MNATLDRLQQRRDDINGEGGFTLIELLIVIVILGILAAIVVFAVVGVTGSSAQAACRSDWKTVETASNAYKAQIGSWPAAESVLGASTTDANSATVGPWLNSADLNGGVVKNGTHYEILVDATTGAVQVYKIDGTTKLGGTATQADCSSVS